MTLEQRIIALAQAIVVDIRALASQGLGSESGVWLPSVQAATGYLSRSGRYTVSLRSSQIDYTVGAWFCCSGSSSSSRLLGQVGSFSRVS